ncbi:MAG TPA: hypothetical protein VFX49_20135 [Chloroflexota bacterium]|nr:hypothetical protein [Chloroflexota bacterium]
MTATITAPITATEFAARRDRHSDDAPVVTTRSYLSGALFPTVEGLSDALRALRGAGRTEDVVGLAIPLEGDDPSAGIVRARLDPPPRRGFNLVEFLVTAMDPHRSAGGWSAGWAPGKNSGLAVELLGDLTRWLVGIQPFRVPAGPDAGDQGGVWILGRPNHAAAVAGLPGDSREGPTGMLATIGVPQAIGLLSAERLAAGDCILTTCETDERRQRSDERMMRRAGASYVFEPVILSKQYGERQA